MKRRAFAIVAALMICAVPVAGLAQVPYSQDFEALPMVDGSLAGDGWLVYGNIFDPTGTIWLWGHGPWPAPNNIGNWCDITTGQGGPEQGMQQLVVYSDYGNGDHAVGNIIESLLFQEQTITGAGVWTFEFDAKAGDLGGASTAAAFIKTIDPNSGWATTSFVTYDTTTLPVEWGTYQITFDVSGFVGQLIQFGFLTRASNYEPCGNFYDNIDFGPEGSSPVEDTTWGAVKAMYQ
ncbi:MAG: hypothetical protein JXB46_02585 [Candidatus Eisenbacteria bacterium]|nr:hypothetical protein [Candidatus Eisenbacteria bacterium]